MDDTSCYVPPLVLGVLKNKNTLSHRIELVGTIFELNDVTFLLYRLVRYHYLLWHWMEAFVMWSGTTNPDPRNLVARYPDFLGPVAVDQELLVRQNLRVARRAPLLSVKQ